MNLIERNAISEMVLEIVCYVGRFLAWGVYCRDCPQAYGQRPANGANEEATGGGAEEAEEKTSFDVVLKAPGGAKLQIVKLVKELTG